MSQPPDPTDLAKLMVAYANRLNGNGLGMVPPQAPQGGTLGSIFGGMQAPAPAPTFGSLGLGAVALNTPPAADRKWIYVTARFDAFLNDLKLTTNQLADGQKKFCGVVSCLNNAYYGHNSPTDNAFLIGSWAKDTQIRPPRDVDLYFVLPPAVHARFEGYATGVNKQSALLQEVKSKLLATYGRSEIKGDGPVVYAGFRSYDLEVVPAFQLMEPRAYWVCDTNNGGSYKTTKPLHEVDHIQYADIQTAGNARNLIRMLKAWQANCSVPIKSFYLELLAINFLNQSAWKNKSHLYYDWICRDFFEWMIGQAGSFVFAPGTIETLWLGDGWKSRAESAHGRAVKACEHETANRMIEAGDEWQKIFGTDIPRIV